MAERHYRIGDVAKQLGLRTSVLRFWETEFPKLKPLRTESGQRVYRERDLAFAKRLQYLLHDQGLTIEGARRVLAGESALSETKAQQSPPVAAQAPQAIQAGTVPVQWLRNLEHELLSMQALLRQHRTII